MLHPDVHLTVAGAVMFPGGFMHPDSFREIMGEEAWQELLKRPRIVSEYDEEETHEET